MPPSVTNHSIRNFLPYPFLTCPPRRVFRRQRVYQILPHKLWPRKTLLILRRILMTMFFLTLWMCSFGKFLSSSQNIVGRGFCGLFMTSYPDFSNIFELSHNKTTRCPKVGYLSFLFGKNIFCFS